MLHLSLQSCIFCHLRSLSLSLSLSLQLSALKQQLDKAVAMSNYFETEMNKAHQVIIVYVNGVATVMYPLAID